MRNMHGRHSRIRVVASSACRRYVDRLIVAICVALVSSWIVDGSAWVFAQDQSTVLPRRAVSASAVAELQVTGRLTPALALEVGVPADVADEIATLSRLIGAKGPEPLSDPLTLLRFYRARGDVQQAAAMYKNVMDWRGSVAIKNIMAAYGEGDEYSEDGGRITDATSWTYRRCPTSAKAKLLARHFSFCRLKVTTSEGEPVAVWRWSVNDYEGFNRDGLLDTQLESYIAHAEDLYQACRAVSLQQKRLVRCRFVIDVQDSGWTTVRYLASLRKATQTGQLYFPDFTSTVTIVRAPALVAGIYKLIQAFLPESMQRKICILGKDFSKELASHAGLDMASIPIFLGGSNADYELS